MKHLTATRFALVFSLIFPFTSLIAAETLEVTVWPGVPPGSEGITEREKVVERGDGKRIIDRSYSDVHRPTLTVHLPDQKPDRPLAAMIICPGGGLTRVVIDKEGHDLARFLRQHKVIGIVLKFRTAKTTAHFYGMPAMEADIRRAIRLVRHNAKRWNIDPRRVGVFGFSAGGMLAATAATKFDSGTSDSKDPVQRHSSRPDFFGGAYPLTTMKTSVVGKHYQRLLFGPAPTDEQLERYSSEKHITADTPPTFLCHARDDRAVRVANTELFAAACRQVGVSCTTFIRDKGGHGYGIRDLGTPINKWRFAFVDWLIEQKLATHNR